MDLLRKLLVIELLLAAVHSVHAVRAWNGATCYPAAQRPCRLA